MRRTSAVLCVRGSQGRLVLSRTSATLSEWLALNPWAPWTIGASSPSLGRSPGDEFISGHVPLLTAVGAGLEDAAWFCFNGDFGWPIWQVPVFTGKCQLY